MVEFKVRRFEKKDIPSIVEFQKRFAEKGGCKFMNRTGFNEEKFRSWLAGGGEGFIAVANGKVVGSTVISRPNPKAKNRLRHSVGIGAEVDPDFHGQGIGSALMASALKLAGEFGYKRAQFSCASENVGMQRVGEKNGFKREGVLRNGFLLDDGRMIDLYMYGRMIGEN